MAKLRSVLHRESLARTRGAVVAIVTLACVVFSATGAQAGFTSTIAPSDVELFWAYEGQGTLQTSKLQLDETAPGVASTLPKGTFLGSYLLSVSNQDVSTSTTYSTIFDFSNPILGVQTQSATLIAGRQVLLGEPDLDPPRHSGALENGEDFVVINGNRLNLKGNLFPNGADTVRVIVAAVPEATSCLVWTILGAAGLTCYRRRAEVSL